MSDATCSAEACDCPWVMQGMCRKHYHQNRYRENKARRPAVELVGAELICSQCGATFTRDHARGPKPQFCPGCRTSRAAARWSRSVPATARRQSTRGRVCEAPECDGPVRSRGLCGLHYARLVRKGTLAGPRDVTCAECGRVFRPRSDTVVCLDCREAPIGRPPRDCPQCGETFTPPRSNPLAKFCNGCNEMAGDSARERWAVRNRDRHQAARAAWKAANPDRVRELTVKRRVLALDLPWEPIDRQAVFDRAGWICHICRKPVDPDLRYPHPMSKTLDHIHPRRHGGGHLYTNLALAHMACNSRKGARVDVL